MPSVNKIIDEVRLELLDEATIFATNLKAAAKSVFPASLNCRRIYFAQSFKTRSLPSSIGTNSQFSNLLGELGPLLNGITPTRMPRFFSKSRLTIPSTASCSLLMSEKLRLEDSSTRI